MHLDREYLANDHMKFITDATNIAIANTENRIWPFDGHIYI